MNLSQRITESRKQHGMSQEGLAQVLGVSRQAVSKWETGDAEPEIGNLQLLGQTLGVSVNWLLSGEGDSELPGLVDAQAAPHRAGRLHWGRIAALLVELLLLLVLMLVRVRLFPYVTVSVEVYQLANYFDPMLLVTMLAAALLMLGIGGQLRSLGKALVWWFWDAGPLEQPQACRHALKAAWQSLAVGVGLRLVADVMQSIASMELSITVESEIGLLFRILLCGGFYLLVAALLLLPLIWKLDQLEQ